MPPADDPVGANRPRAPRTRDKERTRAALLSAARKRFAREGFQATSMKDIAADAGVTAAMVVRYFGTKEELYRKALPPLQSRRDFVDGDVETLGRTMVGRFLDQPGEAADGTLQHAFAMAAGHHDPAELATHTEAFAQAVAERLDGPDARLRAELTAAQLLGLAIMQAVLKSRVLTQADRDDVVRLFGAAVQTCLDAGNDPDGHGPSPHGAKDRGERN